MTRQIVVVSPAAESDITESFRRYLGRNRQAADGFRAAVVDAIDRIARSPKKWKSDEDGNHRYVLHRYPFSVVYMISDDALIVLAVAHHRKRPRYWVSPSE